MFPPQPQASFPIPQNFTLHALSCPFFLRRSDIGLFASKLAYCTQSANSCTVPLPTFPEMYGSVFSSLHISKNSCVPKLLSSVTPPQFVLTIEGRSFFGPMPSFQ